MLKKALLAIALSLFASSAFAVCSQIPLNIKDGSSNTVAMSSASAADGNCKTYIDADTSSQIHSDLTAAIPAGTNLIGKAGFDQTTQGTTNGVTNGAHTYQAVAASATATVLGSTGAAGDYLSHCDVYPASTSPGVVTVFDSTNTAPNSAILFPGGASSTSNLVPFAIPVGAISVNGAWKVTTGASISVVCYGKFT